MSEQLLPNEHKTISKKRVIIEIVLISVIALVVYYSLQGHTPKIVQYLVDDDIDGLTDYIRGKGQLGEIVLIGVQVLETFSIVLPALPVYIVAGIVFGKMEGILICYITNLILNAIMFTFARRTGETAKSRKQSTSPRTEKIINAVTHMKNPDKALIFLYLIPVIPNGLIPTISSQTNIKFSHFMIELAICCLPAISVCVIFGDLLLTIDWSFIVPLIILLIIAGILFLIFKKQITAWVERKVQKIETKMMEENDENK